MCLANQANSHPHPFKVIPTPTQATSTGTDTGSNAAEQHNSSDDDDHHSHYSHESYHSGLSCHSSGCDCAHKKSRSAVYEMKPLPEGFAPSDLDVICARGKEAYNHPGNARFRALVESQLEKYSVSTTKMEKSKIVRDIIETVRKASPRGGFVKKVKGVWMDVGERSAREKTGQQIRDLLHTQYRSSTKAKARTRQQLKHRRNDKSRPRGSISANYQNTTPPLSSSAAFPVERKQLKQAPIAAASPDTKPQAVNHEPVPPLMHSLPGWRRDDASNQQTHYSESIYHQRGQPPSRPQKYQSFFASLAYDHEPDEPQAMHFSSSSAFTPVAAAPPTASNRWTSDPVASAAHHQAAVDAAAVAATKNLKQSRRASTFSDLGFDDLEPLPVDPIPPLKDEDMNASASSLVSEDPFEEAIQQMYGYPFPPPPSLSCQAHQHPKQPLPPPPSSYTSLSQGQGRQHSKQPSPSSYT